MSVTQNKL